jgi:lysophospholipase L1-like esterase
MQSMAQNEQLLNDWGNLKRYATANKALLPTAANGQRVVFMGNSITEGWAGADSIFFKQNPYINRGISGQTTPQMLIRFRADVIELKTAAVVILAGIKDIAQNTGPLTIEQIQSSHDRYFNRLYCL